MSQVLCEKASPTIPAGTTKRGNVAQEEEHWSSKPGVVGSSPTVPVRSWVRSSNWESARLASGRLWVQIPPNPLGILHDATLWCLKSKWSRRWPVKSVVSGFKSRQAPLFYSNSQALNFVHDLEYYFESLAEQGFQNNLFSRSGTKQ